MKGKWKKLDSKAGDKSCAVCGQSFLAYRESSIYCSKKCQSVACNKQDRRMVDATCDHCGCSFQKPWADLRHMQKHNKPVVCGGKCLSLLRGAKVEFACDHCGRMALRFKDEFDKYQFHFCSKQCESESYLHRKTGEAHYRFKDGSTSLSYGQGWTLARRRARKRDNFTCQSCGVTEKETGKALDVHHIIPFRDFDDYREANKLSNLISFCSSCHHRIEAEQINEPTLMDNLKQMVV